MRDLGGPTILVHKLLITEVVIQGGGERWRITAECTFRGSFLNEAFGYYNSALESGETAASAGIFLRSAIQDF